MNSELEARLLRLLDEDDIRQVLYRRARGTDHGDIDLVLSCYHDGATEDHEGFNGPIREYLSGASPVFKDGIEIEVNVHLLGNTEIMVDGDQAETTTTFVCTLTVAEHGTRRDYLNSGRYVDTFERRDGDWKIRHRRCEYEWSRGDYCTDRWWSRNDDATATSS
ncbi:nuclear transport factor 2 family protein [Rhodococcus sp. Eu-32]|uniref:nuclear transport factor 2 family protein n=1 Tax=Rhodococcus sp. Eu-32 TaxID=1017319 RepID=UPI001402383A|nr:nuclear transport factor 2 family protein [Rhodococcus sp. Eu-32]